MTIPLYIRTVTGKKVWLDEPEKSDELNIHDLAFSFGNTCRFVGQLNRFYSVAQHCVLAAGVANKYGNEIYKNLSNPYDVAWLWNGTVPNTYWNVLMHEIEEPFFGDSSTQLKILCPELKTLSKRLAEFLASKLHIQWPQNPFIKEVDNVMMRAEHIHLCNNKDYADEYLWAYAYSDSWFNKRSFEKWSPGKATLKFYNAALSSCPNELKRTFFLNRIPIWRLKLLQQR